MRLTRTRFIVMATAAPLAVVTTAAATAPTLRLSPGSKVKPGGTLRTSGSVAGTGCTTRDGVLIISRALARGGEEFAGVPAVRARISRGRFAVVLRIPANRRPGRYHVVARCGGGNFGGQTITVTAG